MPERTMVDPINDIARQARQGSVSAIIQALNDKLSEAGVRTRAMFDQGILQVLCEAAKPEQLEQSVLVPQIRQILESLQPRHVRRVNINSRIVREQQLLWLEEISRDPDNQLLWSEEITLTKTSLLQRFAQDRQDTTAIAPISPASPRIRREKKVFWRGLVGGASFSLFLLLLGSALYRWLGPNSLGPAQSINSKPSPVASSPVRSAAANSDPFAEAVRLAEQTVGAGQSAQTAADWLDVASRWQRASDLMGKIPATDPRYPTAQDRVQRYRQNSEDAQQKAQSQ